jgi:hypothetical protein
MFPNSLKPEYYSVPYAENNRSWERINLNEIMQQCLLKFQNNTNLNMIVRCEPLPFVEADRSAMTKVFDKIVNMIGRYPPQGSKLFLYVDCIEAKGGTGSQYLTGNKKYSIDFHTNTNADDKWKLEHQQTIKECASILAPYSAGIIVNEIRSAGCLFTISLLSKT